MKRISEIHEQHLLRPFLSLSLFLFYLSTGRKLEAILLQNTEYEEGETYLLFSSKYATKYACILFIIAASLFFLFPFREILTACLAETARDLVRDVSPCQFGRPV